YYGTLNHHPEQPSVMDDETYEICYTGDSSSNISAGRNTLASMLLGQVSDSSSSNIATVGHRRWILNPAMGETGFGFVQTSSGYKYYSAMYAFDESNTDAEYYGVTWPAQNMPVEYFSSTDPWSLSIGDDIDSSVTEVTLTRISDGKTWTFSEDSADGDFYVNNGYYGYFSCIIFRPDDITYSDGDQFAVTITGLDEEVSYQVNFFSCD
ncbi:MAG: secretory protein, partial [Clostridiales bacterium]|nr:secretory protein [Clostridiales bacterium]